MIPRDMDWDYIIVHETGHEYFGNSIGCADLSEMWIQESFTTYLEALFVEFTMSYPDALRYLSKQQYYIANQEPVLGPPGVNWENWDSSDHYYKGAWMLHTLRNAIGDDARWFAIFKGFYQTHALSLVTTEDFIQYVNTQTGQDWHPFFAQYLGYTAVLTLEYRLTPRGKDLQVAYRWVADVADFAMPVRLGKAGNTIRVTPTTTEWQETLIANATPQDFTIATELFLIKTDEVKE